MAAAALSISEGVIDVLIRGKTAITFHKFSEEARLELLLPRRRKSCKVSLKYDPIAEFRNSAYLLSDPTAPTYIGIPSAMFTRAIASAALNISGVDRSKVRRLTWVPGEMLSIYGTPKLLMSVTALPFRSCPDVRTRCIIKEWAAKLRVKFVTPLLQPDMIVRLLHIAGLHVGIGEGRTLNYGQFTVLPASEEHRIRSILRIGRKAQEVAMERAEPYDDETKELLRWFTKEKKDGSNSL